MGNYIIIIRDKKEEEEEEEGNESFLVKSSPASGEGQPVGHN